MSEQSSPQFNKPEVVGEIDITEYSDLQDNAEFHRQNDARSAEQLGALSMHDGSVSKVKIFKDHKGDRQFVVASGPNQGDTVSERAYARHGLGYPDEEMETLESRKDMNEEEQSYFTAMARMFSAARHESVSNGEITEAAKDLEEKFNKATRTRYYSPAMKSAMSLLVLGAHRTGGSLNATIAEVSRGDYLDTEDLSKLDEVISEVERFKYKEDDPEMIERSIVDATNRNILYYPEGERSDNLKLLLNAYAAGAAGADELATEEYLSRMQQQVTASV